MARHKEFDKEKVLEKAMTTFWRYGYEGTSMQVLVENMGINRGSIYDTFGDKRSLFFAAIAYYENTIMREMISPLEAATASKPVIVDLFYNLIDRVVSDRDCRGCLLTNTAIELCPHDVDAAHRIEINLERVQKAFYHALVNARQKEEIYPQQDLNSIASYLTSSIQGLRVISRVNQDRNFLENVVRVILAVLD